MDSWSGSVAQMSCNMLLDDVVKYDGIPTLADVSRVFGNSVSMAIISEHLKSVFRYSGLDVSDDRLKTDSILRDQLGETSFAILKGYYFLNLAELCIFFNELKIGKRGQFVWGSKVNNQAIMVALYDFIQDRQKSYIRLEQEQSRQRQGKGYTIIADFAKALVTGLEDFQRLREKAKNDFKAFRALFPNIPSNYKPEDLFCAYNGKEGAILTIFGKPVSAEYAREAISRYLCDFNVKMQKTAFTSGESLGK